VDENNYYLNQFINWALIGFLTFLQIREWNQEIVVTTAFTKSDCNGNLLLICSDCLFIFLYIILLLFRVIWLYKFNSGYKRGFKDSEEKIEELKRTVNRLVIELTMKDNK
jgi:hypothetical protein